MATRALLNIDKDPFSHWPQPTRASCATVLERLAMLHGMPRRKGLASKGAAASPKDDDTSGKAHAGGTILDSLVRTILSQNTTNRNSSRAMQSLLRAFGGDYENVLQAPVEVIADSIRCGGLANVKAARIKDILAHIQTERGELSLEYLRVLDDARIKQALMGYKGVGPKTASCVLLFCLQRDSFAVDTHVFRIAKKLGWVPPTATREQAHRHLDERIPKAMQYPLHVLFIRHGKTCYACAANGRPQQQPKGPCPL